MFCYFDVSIMCSLFQTFTPFHVFVGKFMGRFIYIYAFGILLLLFFLTAGQSKSEITNINVDDDSTQLVL